MRKRPRTLDMHPGNAAASADPHPNQSQQAPPVGDDAFINDQDAVDSAGDEDEDEEKPKSDKKAGRRKIKIEFIQDKSRRHITFSKRKAGIMKKAYELSTLTGTQVLLLVVSETGLVYTFTTAKLQPLVTQPEGKNLIQACLNAPQSSLPSSSMPIGPPLGRPSAMSMTGPPPNNLPGGLTIGTNPSGNSAKDDEDDGDNDDAAASHGGRASAGDKRRRRASSTAGAAPSSNTRGATSPHSPNSTIPPPPLSIPTGAGPAQPSPGGHAPHQNQQAPPSQISLNSPTSPQQQHQQVSATSPQYQGGSYAHHPGQQHHQQPAQHDASMYGNHLMSPGGYTYGSGPGSGPTQGGQPPLGGLAAAAAAQHTHWGPQQPQVGQGSHYGRR